MTVPGLVSVILPVFNREAMFLEAVACVEAQTYKNLEVIVVDDGSTDDTGTLCDRLVTESAGRVRAIHQSNSGPGAARESGRRLARGEYIQYLDSDDWLEARKLERQVATLERERAAGVCYCKTRERLADGTDLGRPSMQTGVRHESIFPAFLDGRLWQTVTPLWRREATDRIGAWSSLRVEEDMEYDARAGALGVRPVWCPEWLAEHRHHGGPRASGDGARDVSAMRDRARSHQLVYGHAVAIGIGHGEPGMQRYARELFLLARQAGAAGLPEEARELFRLAREASGPSRARGVDFIAYAAMAGLVGWKATGRLACLSDRLRTRANQ